MPHRDIIVNLPGFTIKKVSGYLPLIIDLHYRRKARCVYCNKTKLRKKASFIRRVKHESIGHRTTILRFKAYKFYCNLCCRYFNQQFHGILNAERNSIATAGLFSLANTGSAR